MKNKSLLFLCLLLINIYLGAQHCEKRFPKCDKKQCEVSDLTNIYQVATQIITCLENAIKELPQQNQSDLLSSLKTTRSTVEKEYQNSKKAADNALKQYEHSKPAIKKQVVDQFVTPSVQKIKNAVNILMDEVKNTQQATGQAVKLEEQKRKAIEIAQQEEAFHEKMMSLFQALKPGIELFNVNSAEAHSILLDLHVAGKYDVSFMPRIERVTQKWKDLTAQFYGIYQQNNQAIRIDDSTNYVVICVRALIYFYINLIEIQLHQTRTMKRSDAYPLLSLLVTQMVGNGGTNNDVQSLGYDATVKNLIDKHFQENQAYLNKIYLQSKVDLTFEQFKAYLTQLLQSPDPEKQLPYAEKFYALIMSDNKVLPENVQDTIIKSVNQTVALLYILSVQKVLKKMRIDQDTTSLRDAAIRYYQKAAEYYRNGQDTSNANKATDSYTNLTQAAQALATAQASQKSGDLQNAVAFFTIAQTGFQSSGDSIDAALATVNLLTVQAQFALQQAKSVSDTVKQNIEHYSDYITNISAPTIIPEKTTAQFHDLLTIINQGYKSIFQYYLNAISSYQMFAEQNSSATPSKEGVALVHNLNLAASLLQKVIEANELMLQADQLVDSNSINSALTSYKNAIRLYQLADQLYAKYPDLAHYCPLYPSTLVPGKSSDWTYTVIAHRHVAKKLVEQAAKAADTITALQYYYSAYLSNRYLTNEMQQFLDESIKKIAAQKEVIQELFEQAQKNEKEARALTGEAWKPIVGVGYLSKATILWENVLQQYNAALYLGYEDAKQAYLKTIDAYATAYAANVPSTYYPALGVALIKYRQYVLFMTENNEQQAGLVLKDIGGLILPFFTTVEDLITAVDTPSLISSSSDNQARIVQWQSHLEQALIKQDTIVRELAPKASDEQEKVLLLFESISDEQDNVTYTFVPAKKSVTLANPALKLADVTKALGDYYFQKGEYILAYAAYVDAQNQYQNGNRFDRITAMQQQFDSAKTLYYASLYQESVLPQGSITFGGFTAPVSYEVKMYKQTVPTVIVDNFPSADKLKAYSPEQTSSFTVSVMIDLYLYWWIRIVFGQTRYSSLVKIMKPLLGKNKDEITLAVQKALSDEDEQTDCSNIIMNASAFQKDLLDRVAQKKTSFTLAQERTQDGNIISVLYEYSIPIAQFPIITIDTNNQFYMGYPSAYLFYTWSSRLFAPGKDRVVVNGISFAPSNKPEQYQALHDKILEIYFSKANVYQATIKSIKDSDSYKKLITLDKNDLTLKIADYLTLFSDIRDNYLKMITYCDNALNEDFVDRKSQKGKKINDLVGSLYKKMGDDLIVFLIGDPRDKDYHVTVLDAISSAYVNAIINYGYDPNLYKKYAELCKKGGDVLSKHGMFFVSTRLYVKAEKAYRNIMPQTQELMNLADAVALIRLRNVCKAATINIGQYIDARNNGVMLKNDDGTTKKVPMKKLIHEYNMTLQQAGGAEDVIGLNVEALQKLNYLKAGLLDSLIFYSGAAVGSKNPRVAGFQLLIESLVPQADDTTNLAIKSGAAKLIASFLQRNNILLKNDISADAVAAVTLVSKKNNFPDGKTFADVIQRGFDIFEQSATTGKTVMEKAIALSALYEWCTLLYNSFGSLFINDFLGGFPKTLENLVVTVNNLNGSIDTEISAMNSATWQFFTSAS